MPTPSQRLTEALLDGGHGPLAAAISDRMYPVRLPQGTPYTPKAKFPCVVYRRIEGPPPAESHSGWGGMAQPRWVFDCWDITHYGAEALAESLRAALQGMGAQQVAVHDADPGGDETLSRVIVEAYTLWDEEAE